MVVTFIKRTNDGHRVMRCSYPEDKSLAPKGRDFELEYNLKTVVDLDIEEAEGDKTPLRNISMDSVIKIETEFFVYLPTDTRDR